MLQSPVPHSSPASRPTALLALLALAGIWGYNWVQMKIAVTYAPPFVFSAIRIGLGALCLLALLVVRRQSLWPQEVPKTALSGVLQIAGVYGFATWALVSGGAGRTSVLVYTMPFWTLLLAWVVLGERLRPLQWLAVGASGVGLMCILGHIQWDMTLLSKGLAVLAGLCWAGGAVTTKLLRQQRSLDLLSLTAWQMTFAAIPLAWVAWVTPATPIQWTPAFVFALVYNVIPATVIATLLWLYILDALPAGVAGVGILLNPVIGVLAAWVQLGEVPTTLERVGMAFIAVALLCNTTQALRADPPPSTSPMDSDASS
jgi:drug/metabolite transporter (DMT)-like permease